MKYDYEFKDNRLFELATTHISLANDLHIESNQRLEFLGDSVLSFVVATHIYHRYKECAKDFVAKTLGDMIGNTSYVELENYKSEIQSYYQKRDRNREVVKYRLISKVGPDHNPTFKVEAIYNNKVIGRGTGKNRKSAEQEAAKQALQNVGAKENEKV